mmetsp:Transcript_160021/g.292091  ORF Transcript_160021/g.292091 Transcript_160021/m.292091 type:complete len:596 (-) Transcript_160021:43-1830(-)
MTVEKRELISARASLPLMFKEGNFSGLAALDLIFEVLLQHGDALDRHAGSLEELSNWSVKDSEALAKDFIFRAACKEFITQNGQAKAVKVFQKCMNGGGIDQPNGTTLSEKRNSSKPEARKIPPSQKQAQFRTTGKLLQTMSPNKYCHGISAPVAAILQELGHPTPKSHVQTQVESGRMFADPEPAYNPYKDFNGASPAKGLRVIDALATATKSLQQAALAPATPFNDKAPPAEANAAPAPEAASSGAAPAESAPVESVPAAAPSEEPASTAATPADSTPAPAPEVAEEAKADEEVEAEKSTPVDGSAPEKATCAATPENPDSEKSTATDEDPTAVDGQAEEEVASPVSSDTASQATSEALEVEKPAAKDDEADKKEVLKLALKMGKGPATTTHARNVCYEVVHDRIAVRETASLSGRICGAARKGDKLIGTPYRAGGFWWLRLNVELCQREEVMSLPAERVQGAWALIDGSPLGLPLLLKEKELWSKFKVAELVAQCKSTMPDLPRSGNGVRVWAVVGGLGNRGIAVRKEKEATSEAYEARLQLGAIIEEIEVAGQSLHYQRIHGDGPDVGWVSLLLYGSPLVLPYNVAVELHG